MNLPLQTHATSQVKILIVNQVLTATILVDSKEHWKQNVDFCLEFILFLANLKVVNLPNIIYHEDWRNFGQP